MNDAEILKYECEKCGKSLNRITACCTDEGIFYCEKCYDEHNRAMKN